MSRTVVPGPVVIPGCIEVSLLFSSSGRNFKNVLHGNLAAAGPINPSLPETLFTGFKTQLTSSGFGAQLSSGTSFTGVTVKDLRAPNNPVYLSTGAAVPGTGAATQLPINDAFVVTLRTGQSGRGFRGRVYLSGLIAASSIDGRTFIGATATAALAFINGVNSVMTTNSIPLVVAQRALAAGTDSHGNPLPARPASVILVTSVVNVNSRVDSQRKRLGR